jgi:hypothetical protein
VVEILPDRVRLGVEAPPEVPEEFQAQFRQGS